MESPPIKFIIAGKDDDDVLGLYSKHFRGEKLVAMQKASPLSIPNDLLVLLLPSAFGLLPAQFVFKEVTNALGEEFLAKLKETIQKRFLGEVPQGTAFILKTKGMKQASKVTSAVCCAFPYRILTPNGDNLAWLDPIYCHDDWAYSTFRSILVAILKHKQKNNKVETVVCPDLLAIRNDAPDASRLADKETDACVRQLLLAWRSVMSPPPKREWADGILLMREILNKDHSGDASASGTELQQLLSTGELLARGLYTKDELELVCEWTRDSSNKERQNASAKVLAAALKKTEDSKFTLPRADVAKLVSDKDKGCLGYLLAFVQDGTVTVHTEIGSEDIDWDDEIGSGTAGSVYRGIWKGKNVAVKKFRGVAHEDFLKELSIMSIVQHMNLVECYGGCTKKDTPFIVLELMQGNISDILRQKTISLDLGIKLRVALEVAHGMAYLHNHCNLIHRDLKSLNLLCSLKDEVMTVKICDFGVSRVVDRRKTMTSNIGTVSWIAPEIFEQRKYTEKADVYSFGIVLWELYTRKIPFTDIHSFSIPVAVIKGDRPPIPKDCPPQLKKLIRACWDAKMNKRPGFTKIIELIQKIFEQLPPLARSQATINLQPIARTKDRPKSKGRGGRPSRKQSAGNAATAATVVADKELVEDEEELDRRALATPPSDTANAYSGNSSPSPSASTAEISAKSSGELASDNTLEASSDHSGSLELSSSGSSPSKKGESGKGESLQRKLSDKGTGVLNGVKQLHTVTCQIPDQWAPPIAKLEIQVNKYFSRLKQDLDLGTITVGDERYLLFRGHSLAVDFLTMVQQTFEFDGDGESLEFAQNFLYDLGYSIGKSDSDNFLTAIEIEDPIAKNNLGLVVVAYTGMAFVQLLPESQFNPKSPNDESMIYEFAYSFEADSWKKKGKTPCDHTVCMMAAGYMSGWGEGATNTMRATAELECTAKGDHTCLFIRASPQKLESTIRKFMDGKDINKVDPIPSFLKNRSDTLPAAYHKKNAKAVGAVESEEDVDESWFEKGFNKLFKRSKSSTKTSDNPKEVGSPKSMPKLNTKRFQAPELSVEEIDKRASQELNSFFIDPTTATVEMAEERCVLLRGDALAYGFYDLVAEMFNTPDDKSTLAQQFTFKFLFDLGRTIGSSNQAWFVEKIGLGQNAIERAHALPVNMAYFGWCDLIIRSGLSHKELQKSGENFKIICDVNNSFEASSYQKHKKQKDCKSPVCYMHAGYISGWFEASFNTRVVAVEVQCKAQGANCCQFVVAHANAIKKHIPTTHHTAVGTATTSGVLPLLAKFKEKRRESGKAAKQRAFDLLDPM